MKQTNAIFPEGRLKLLNNPFAVVELCDHPYQWINIIHLIRSDNPKDSRKRCNKIFMMLLVHDCEIKKQQNHRNVGMDVSVRTQHGHKRKSNFFPLSYFIILHHFLFLMLLIL